MPPLALTETPILGLQGRGIWDQLSVPMAAAPVHTPQGAAHSLWTTVRYVEAVRPQFLSLRQSRAELRTPPVADFTPAVLIERPTSTLCCGICFLGNRAPQVSGPAISPHADC